MTLNIDINLVEFDGTHLHTGMDFDMIGAFYKHGEYMYPGDVAILDINGVYLSKISRDKYLSLIKNNKMSDQTEISDLRTTGERRVRIQFNPSNDDSVFQIKQRGAQLIDLVDQHPVPPNIDDKTVSEFMRLKHLAMTEIEHGIMDAVKMATT